MKDGEVGRAGGFAPRPPGFSALVPSWVWTGGNEWGSLPTDLGPGVGAQVASLRSPVLRPGHGEVYSYPAQAARARARILFHRPCKVVMELNSGKATGTR